MYLQKIRCNGEVLDILQSICSTLIYYKLLSDLPPVPARPVPPIPNRPAPAPPVPPRSIIKHGVALPGLVDQNELPSPPKRTPTSKPSSPSEPSEASSAVTDDGASSAPETVSAPDAVSPDNQDNTMAVLIERRDQYKHAALQAKRSGDTELALTFVKVVKVSEYQNK